MISTLEQLCDEYLTPTISTFREYAHKTLEAYFEPKEFERSSKVYESLGVTYFAKLWKLTVGRMSPVHKGKFIYGKKSLANYEQATRIYEQVHLTGNAMMLWGIALDIHSNQPISAGVWFGVNTLVNIYPILLQRYNRTRVYRVLEKINQRTAIF